MVFPPLSNQNTGLTQFYSNRNMLQQPPHYIQNPQDTGNILTRFNQAKPALTEMATKGIGGMSKTLNNIQQVLKVVETTAPLIQQYGPLVKNLPVMLKMIKALNETDIDNIESMNESIDLQEENLKENVTSNNHLVNNKEENEQSNIAMTGISEPKLFI